MKITASDVAKVCINLFKDEEEGITNLKLQKLLYFAQGFSYQRFSKPLFDDEIEAWELGPVVLSVYHQYSSYGREPIRNSSDIQLDSATERLILDVAREYGKYTSGTLVNMTHEAGTAWSKHNDGYMHTIIPKSSIEEEFKQRNALPTIDWDSIFATSTTVDLDSTKIEKNDWMW